MLQPGGRETPEEPVQGLGVQMTEERREVWDRRESPELPLGQVVEKLLGKPVQNSEGNLVGFPIGLAIVHCQTKIEVRPHLLDAVAVFYGERSSLPHHEIDQDAVGGETMTTGRGCCWERHPRLQELPGISEGHCAPPPDSTVTR